MFLFCSGKKKKETINTVLYIVLLLLQILVVFMHYGVRMLHARMHHVQSAALLPGEYMCLPLLSLSHSVLFCWGFVPFFPSEQCWLSPPAVFFVTAGNLGALGAGFCIVQRELQVVDERAPQTQILSCHFEVSWFCFCPNDIAVCAAWAGPCSV